MSDDSGPSRMLDALQTVQDECTAHAENGHPIRVNDPGTEHGRKLVRALGAEIVTRQDGFS